MTHLAVPPALGVFLLLLPGGAFASQPPIIDEFSASPPAVAPGGVVNLTLHAHDPDCPSTCTSGCGQYINSGVTDWFATGGSFVSIDYGLDASPYTTTAQWQAPATEGNYTISVYVGDSGNFLCGGRGDVQPSLVIQVTSSPNQPPVVDSVTADPTQLFPGQTSDLTCAASDPDSDPVTYSWSTDLGNVTPGTGGAATFTAGDPATATVTCRATDPGGLFGEDSVVISVSGAVADATLTTGLVAPLRLDVDSTGNVYVVDRAADAIHVLDLFDGSLVYELPASDVTSLAVDWKGDLLLGTDDGPVLVDRAGAPAGVVFAGALADVSDVAVDPLNQRYGVLHRRAGRVVVYDALGSQVTAFGSTGDGPDQFKSPQGLAATPSGQWVVGDTGHGLIKLFDGTGVLQTSFGGLGGQVGEFVRLDDVVVDAAGVIYASDRFQDWIVAFNPDGSVRETLGTYGDGLGQFETVAGVAVADAFDRLLGASVNTSSIQVFRTSDDPVVPLGPAVPELTPNALLFPPQATGTTSGAQPLVLSNTGASILGVHGVTVQGEFLQTHDCGPFIDPGQSCTVQVSFRPAVPGTRTGSIVLDTSADPARRASSLSGEGFVPRPEASLTPALLAFGDQTVGTTGSPLPATLSNIGLAPLQIASIDVSTGYLQTNDCPASLAAGASCMIQVRFSPTVVSDDIPGTLAVTHDAAGSPHTVALSGRSIPVVPSIAIDDVALDEGDGGDAFQAVFTVTLSETTTENVSVDYATTPGTADADVDYQSVSGTLLFLAGETQQTISVTIHGDVILEPDEETFSVDLDAAVNAVIDVGAGLGTIRDDEPCIGPNLVLNPSAEERPDGAFLPEWTIAAGTWQRRGAPPAPVDGEFYFYPTTTDYAELTQEIDVSAYADRIDADRQWFRFEAWARTLYEAPDDTARIVVEYRDWSNTTVLDAFDSGEFSSPGLWLRVVDERQAPIGTRWIRIQLISRYLGDAYFDAAALRSLRAATIAVGDTGAYEGDVGFQTATFDVWMACPLHEEVLVDYATVDQSAQSGADYLAEVGTLTFVVGDTLQSVDVSIVGDEENEGHETFGLALSLVAPSEALLLDGEGVCLVRNDDACPRSSSYWRSNAGLWPQTWLEVGGVEYEQSELLALLGYHGSDASHRLARDLIATKLNLLQGSDPGIQPTVDAADALLVQFPPGSDPGGQDRQDADDLTDLLNDYNEVPCPGGGGSIQQPSEPESPPTLPAGDPGMPTTFGLGPAGDSYDGR